MTQTQNFEEQSKHIIETLNIDLNTGKKKKKKIKVKKATPEITERKRGLKNPAAAAFKNCQVDKAFISLLRGSRFKSLNFLGPTF